MADEVCLICTELLSVGEIVTVKEKGLINLLESSVKRNDEKFNKSQDLKSLTVHVECRKVYTSINSIISANKQRTEDANQNTSRCRRSLVPSFDFPHKCLFCSNDIPLDFEEREKKKPIKKRRVIFNVRSLPLRVNILQVAENRRDKWSQEVAMRVSNIYDLVAIEAKYHHQCMTKFFTPFRLSKKRGRPELEDIAASMEEIYNFLENNRDECQFSLAELLKNVTGYVPDHRTVQKKLFEKYGDDIMFAQTANKSTIVCWRDTGYKLLVRSWYDNKKQDEQEERLRIVQMAAAIIREDIRSKPYELDYYPPPDQFLADVETVIPQSLKLLLTDIILKNKHSLSDKREKKCTSIAHAIISATRPRSFLSPLQIGLAAFLNRKYGSKDLLNVLSAMGFCGSYSEASLFEVSTIMRNSDTTVLPHHFSQFIFDNADVNINTLDGLNTFHAMGGLQSITPYTAVSRIGNIERLKKIPSANTVAKFGHVPVQVFEKPSELGLKNIKIRDLDEINPISQGVVLSSCDLLWLYGKSQKMIHVPGWNGFMEQVTSHMHYEKSRIICLPFINAPPSNYDTIYTSLLCAVEKSGSQDNQKCFVTFDQPLYYKARDIVASMPPDSPLKNVVVRLGGFHLLMSFMGAIGYIMAGSRLKELLSLVYAPVSVEKMMTGHAYARALRGHLLTHAALAQIVLEQVDFTDAERVEMEEILQDVSTPSFLITINEEPFKSISRKFEESLANIKKRGSTAELWVQYFNMVTLVKQFVEAERTGNWKLHLECVQKMLPYFHASGHFLYAKSAQLYLQDMLELESKMDPQQYTFFVKDGFFTIRRSDKFWSGIWSDMTIEQTLMRMMKSNGGLTHGRGITDSVLTRWILAMSILHYISEGIEEFSGVSFATSEQHVDMRKSRVIRDMKDILCVYEFFSSHPPFPNISDIMSISTGIIGDEKINCHKAVEIGTVAMKQMTNNNYAQVKFKRSNRVRPLGILNTGIKVRDETIPIEPLLIFQRISITKKTDEELQNYLCYELAPFPLALFDEAGMRKNKKSAAYVFFTKKSLDTSFGNKVYVIDGGYLLHRVVWHQGETFAIICAKYIGYIERYYQSNTIIIFDGYPKELCRSIKSAERLRRSKNSTCADVLFDETMSATISQEKFLSNENNKSRLISLLTEKLIATGFRVRQAEEDADTLIVNTAIDLSPSYDSVIIVGEDIDLLILLAAFAVSQQKIYFLKPGKGKSESSLYSADSLSQEIIAEDLLFLHAFSGCDTTSALFRQGKLKIFKLLKKNDHLREAIQVFRNKNVEPDIIAKAGELFFLAVYGAHRNEQSINTHRYQCFTKSITKSRFDLASLPPTEAAAREHSLRSYLQVQQWCGNQKLPEEWGWKRRATGLAPIPSKKDPVPKSLLKFISCKCHKGCGSACGCRKAGLNCSIICANCRGQSCDNAKKLCEMFDDDPQDDIALQTFLSEQMDDEKDTTDGDSTTKLSSSDDKPSTSKIQKLY